MIVHSVGVVEGRHKMIYEQNEQDNILFVKGCIGQHQIVQVSKHPHSIVFASYHPWWFIIT
jgi:hypothetical protein